jgi:hypothetical protein
LKSPAGAGVYPPGGGANPGGGGGTPGGGGGMPVGGEGTKFGKAARGKPGGGGGGRTEKPGRGGGKGGVGKPVVGGGMPAVPGGKPWSGGMAGNDDDKSAERIGPQSTNEHLISIRLTRAPRRGTLRHGDIIVGVFFLFFLCHTRGRAFWHEDIVVCVFCT